MCRAHRAAGTWGVSCLQATPFNSAVLAGQAGTGPGVTQDSATRALMCDVNTQGWQSDTGPIVWVLSFYHLVHLGRERWEEQAADQVIVTGKPPDGAVPGTSLCQDGAAQEFPRASSGRSHPQGSFHRPAPFSSAFLWAQGSVLSPDSLCTGNRIPLSWHFLDNEFSPFYWGFSWL